MSTLEEIKTRLETAGEAAFDYLLMYGLAAPDPNPNHQEDIVFVEMEE